MCQARFCQAKTDGRRQTADAILDAAPEVDGRRFGKVFGRTTDFGNGIALPDNLGQHLIVKNKIVGIPFQRQFFQKLP